MSVYGEGLALLKPRLFIIPADVDADGHIETDALAAPAAYGSIAGFSCTKAGYSGAVINKVWHNLGDVLPA